MNVKHHNRARALAKRYTRLSVPSVDADDYMQEARLGVVEAEKRFDPMLNMSADSYSWMWMRRNCFRHYLSCGRPMRIPISTATHNRKTEEVRRTIATSFASINASSSDESNEYGAPNQYATNTNIAEQIENTDMVRFLISNCTEREAEYLIRVFMNEETSTEVAKSWNISRQGAIALGDRCIAKLRKVASVERQRARRVAP